MREFSAVNPDYVVHGEMRGLYGAQHSSQKWVRCTRSRWRSSKTRVSGREPNGKRAGGADTWIWKDKLPRRGHGLHLRHHKLVIMAQMQHHTAAPWEGVLRAPRSQMKPRFRDVLLPYGEKRLPYNRHCYTPTKGRQHGATSRYFKYIAANRLAAAGMLA